MSSQLRDSSGHDHPHGLSHAGTVPAVEPGYYGKRVQALEALLVEKGITTKGEVQKIVSELDLRSPADGARVVAKAWADPKFNKRLMANPKAAVAELGYENTKELPDLVVVENTDKVHYLVVCTLCSCYPRWLLGRPPDWYKSLTYRSRAVVDPRGVMREFGLELDMDVEVRVLDSTADVRYLVLPKRPAGTEGLSEKELASLVTRDSMIGVSEALSPQPVGR
jgi:nitrile hydratase